MSWLQDPFSKFWLLPHMGRLLPMKLLWRIAPADFGLPAGWGSHLPSRRAFSLSKSLRNAPASRNDRDLASADLAWIHHLPLPAWICEIEDISVSFANEAAFALTGKSGSELYQGSLLTHLGLQGQQPGPFLRSLLQATTPVSFAYLRQDGQEGDLQLAGSWLPGSSQRQVLIQAVEVSAAKRQHAVPEGAAATVLKTMPLLSWITDTSGRATLFQHPEFGKRWGSGPMNHHWWRGAVHPEDWPRVSSRLGQLPFSPEGSMSFRWRNHQPGQPERWIDWHSMLLAGEHHLPSVVHVFLERELPMQSKLMIQRRQREAAAVHELAQIGTWSWSRNTGKVEWSEEFRRMHEVDFPARIHAELPFPCLENESHFDLKMLLETLDEKLLPFPTEYKITTQSGLKKDIVLVFLEAERDAKGNIDYLSGIVQDVTTQREYERVQRQLLKDVDRLANGMKGFRSAVSHSLRTPVSQFKGLLGLLASGKLTQNDTIMRMLRDALETMDRSMAEMDQMLRLDQSVLDSIPRRYSWMEIWHPVTSSLQSSIIQTEATLSVDFAEAKHVFGVKEYLIGICDELLKNAIRFREFDRKLNIEIWTERGENNQVWLHIQDNGIGVDVGENPEKVFSIYRTFHEKRSGRGLGLHLVQVQLESMGGKVLFNSTPGVGTKVSIALTMDD